MNLGSGVIQCVCSCRANRKLNTRGYVIAAINKQMYWKWCLFVMSASENVSCRQLRQFVGRRRPRGDRRSGRSSPCCASCWRTRRGGRRGGTAAPPPGLRPRPQTQGRSGRWRRPRRRAAPESWRARGGHRCKPWSCLQAFSVTGGCRARACRRRAAAAAGAVCSGGRMVESWHRCLSSIPVTKE